MNAIKSVVAKLETELHEKSTNVSFLEAEIRTLQRKLQMKDAEIAKQERELHKLRVSKSISIRSIFKFDSNSNHPLYFNFKIPALFQVNKKVNNQICKISRLTSDDGKSLKRNRKSYWINILEFSY